MANIRWKVITILIVGVVFTALGVYPIVAARFGINSPGWLMDKQLKLGLDLKGGVQLVLRVETDDALKGETDVEMERLREELQNRKITFSTLTAVNSTWTGFSRRRTPTSARRRPSSRPTSIAAATSTDPTRSR
jgi:preprotein translocase subunit SecD